MTKDFTLDATGRFFVKTWQDEAFVYDSISGDSHLLEPFAVEITRYLAAGERSNEDVTRHLLAAFKMAKDDSSLNFIAASLDHLERVGILLAQSN